MAVEQFDGAAINQVLQTEWLGRPLRYLDSSGSTNEVLKELAEAGAPAGTAVVANYQSRGKGRLGRRWDAPAGTSLLVSLLFRPGWPALQATWLTMLAGLSSANAIEEETGLTVGLKWPNDLMVGDGKVWRKTGGVLLESEIRDGRQHWAVLGLGVNVNIPRLQLPQVDVPVTSLLVELGRQVSRLTLLASILQRFEAHYAAAEAGLSPQPEWNQKLISQDQKVTVSGPGLKSPLVGTAEGTDEWGRLLVRDNTGHLHVVAAGDVSLRS